MGRHLGLREKLLRPGIGLAEGQLEVGEGLHAGVRQHGVRHGVAARRVLGAHCCPDGGLQGSTK